MFSSARIRRRASVVAAACACSLLPLAVPGAASAAATSNAVTALETPTVALLSNQLNAYATTQGPYVNGNWESSDMTSGNYWAENDGGPMTAAATIYALTGHSNQTLLNEAEQTANTQITTRQASDGGFEDTPGDPTSVSAIDTMFFGVEFGTTYDLIAGDVSASTRASWQQSLAAAANYLITSGNATWYVNGNINIGFAELFYLTWKATGNPTFEKAYNAEWNFVTAPPQAQFPGDGLVITTPPTTADGSNGDGYLTETGAGGTGFDPEYTSLQLDVACRLYLLSGDPRALRLANLEINQELPLVNSAMSLNTSGGTRHTTEGRETAFLTSAYAVLGLFGGRSDLAPTAATELSAEQTWFSSPQDNAVMRRALGNSVAVTALAEAMASAGNAALLYHRPALGILRAGALTSASDEIATVASAGASRSHRGTARHARPR